MSSFTASIAPTHHLTFKGIALPPCLTPWIIALSVSSRDVHVLHCKLESEVVRLDRRSILASELGSSLCATQMTCVVNPNYAITLQVLSICCPLYSLTVAPLLFPRSVVLVLRFCLIFSVSCFSKLTLRNVKGDI